MDPRTSFGAVATADGTGRLFRAMQSCRQGAQYCVKENNGSVAVKSGIWAGTASPVNMWLKFAVLRALEDSMHAGEAVSEISPCPLGKFT